MPSVLIPNHRESEVSFQHQLMSQLQNHRPTFKPTNLWGALATRCFGILYVGHACSLYCHCWQADAPVMNCLCHRCRIAVTMTVIPHRGLDQFQIGCHNFSPASAPAHANAASTRAACLLLGTAAVGSRLWASRLILWPGNCSESSMLRTRCQT